MLTDAILKTVTELEERAIPIDDEQWLALGKQITRQLKESESHKITGSVLHSIETTIFTAFEVLKGILRPAATTTATLHPEQAAMIIDYVQHNPQLKELFKGITANAALIRQELNTASTPREKLQIIHRYICSFKKTEGLDCEPLSVLFVKTGERLGLEINLRKMQANPQSHIFVELEGVYFDITNGKTYNSDVELARDLTKAGNTPLTGRSIPWSMNNVMAEVKIREAIKQARLNNFDETVKLTAEAIRLAPDRIKETHMLMALALNSLSAMLIEKPESARLISSIVLGLDKEILDDTLIGLMADILKSLPKEVQENITIVTNASVSKLQKAMGESYIRITDKAPDERVKTAIIVHLSDKKAPFKIDAENIRFVEVPEASVDQVVLPIDILYAIFQFPFREFITDFGTRIGLSKSERDALFNNADTYADIIKIKPVDKKDAEAIMQRLIEMNA